MNYSGEQYDDPAENITNYRRQLDGFLNSHKDPHYYDQHPQTHIDELDDDDLPLDSDVIEDYNNEEDYYPQYEDNTSNCSDDGSHCYHTLTNIDELDEEENTHKPYYPDKTYKPTDNDDEPQFPSIDSDQYYTPDKSPDSSYHTANDSSYEDLEDFCCRYCTDQHPNNWCPIPHHSCLDTCLIPEDHPHYIDDVPVDVTCPAEGQHRPYSYWA